jgi:arsenite methyltransferase
MLQTTDAPAIDLDSLRQAIRDEYALVADQPQHGFHFLVGRPLARFLGYQEDWLDGIPEPTIASFAGAGNPFRSGRLQPGERVVDVGSGGGIDSLIAAKMVGPAGRVVGVDMTPAMLADGFIGRSQIGRPQQKDQLRDQNRRWAGGGS